MAKYKNVIRVLIAMECGYIAGGITFKAHPIVFVVTALIAGACIEFLWPKRTGARIV